MQKNNWFFNRQILPRVSGCKKVLLRSKNASIWIFGKDTLINGTKFYCQT